MKKSGSARTTFRDISPTGFELTTDALNAIVGGVPVVCGGDTPYPVSSLTLNSQGQSDTQTDCSSKEP